MKEESERSRPSVDGELRSNGMSAPARWILLTGDRRVLALGLLLGVAGVLGASLASGLAAVRNPASLARLFGAFVGGNLTLITVVITINQLILSREFGTPGEIDDRISAVIEYRNAVEETADVDVSPITPEAFLEFLSTELETRAETMQGEGAAISDEEYRTALRDYAETLSDQSRTINEALEAQPGGAFTTLLTVLDADFTSDRYRAERLRSNAGDDVPDQVLEGLGDVLDLLEYIGAARQYFKSLYMQQELTALSQWILYTGVPAVTASVLAVWLYGHPTGATMDSPAFDVLVFLATLVALSPLAVLVAYIIRVTTITRKTMSLMPFKTREMRST